MTSFTAQKSVSLKIVYNKKKIQIFGMNMPFISSSEAKNAYFMSGEFIQLVAKKNKMLGKPRILSLFPNSFNKFNKT